MPAAHCCLGPDIVHVSVPLRSFLMKAVKFLHRDAFATLVSQRHQSQHSCPTVHRCSNAWASAAHVRCACPRATRLLLPPPPAAVKTLSAAASPLGRPSPAPQCNRLRGLQWDYGRGFTSDLALGEQEASLTITSCFYHGIFEAEGQPQLTACTCCSQVRLLMKLTNMHVSEWASLLSGWDGAQGSRRVRCLAPWQMHMLHRCQKLCACAPLPAKAQHAWCATPPARSCHTYPKAPTPIPKRPPAPPYQFSLECESG